MKKIKNVIKDLQRVANYFEDLDRDELQNITEEAIIFLGQVEHLVIKGVPQPMPNGEQVEWEYLIGMLWAYMQKIESIIKPDKDILDKRDIEIGYEIWNKIHGSKLKPRWLR